MAENREWRAPSELERLTLEFLVGGSSRAAQPALRSQLDGIEVRNEDHGDSCLHLRPQHGSPAESGDPVAYSDFAGRDLLLSLRVDNEGFVHCLDANDMVDTPEAATLPPVSSLVRPQVTWSSDAGWRREGLTSRAFRRWKSILSSPLSFLR